MKKVINYISIIAFFAILIVFAAGTILNVKFSDTDNSDTSTDMDFRDKLSQTFDANFPLQNNLSSLYTNVMLLAGKRDFHNVYILDDKLVKVSPMGTTKKINENVDLINQLSENTDIPVYVMLVPTAAGIYSSDLPAYATGTNQKSVIDKMYYSFDKSIGTIDAYYPLYSCRDEYIYYRTEDCWTSFGAYHTYYEAIKKLGFSPKTMSEYDLEYVTTDFNGSLTDTVNYNNIQSDRINLFRLKYKSSITSVKLTEGQDIIDAKSVYFRSALKTDEKNNIFLLGDRYGVADITMDNPDAPSLLIIKGSFANTIVPFLAPNFSRITLVDPDILSDEGKSLANVCNINDYDQILVLDDVVSFSKKNSLNVLLK